jgi:hypothetical protein
MASSSNVPKATLFTEAEKNHDKLAEELKTKPEIKPGVHMVLLTSIQDNLSSLNKAASTANNDDYALMCNTIYDPVYHYGGGTIEDVKLDSKQFETVVSLLTQRKKLVKDYLEHNIAKSEQKRVCGELMGDLNKQLSTKFTSGIFVPAPSSS